MIQITEEKLVSEQVLKNFLDEINHYSSINNSGAFEIKGGRIVIDVKEYGLKELDEETTLDSELVFHLTTGVVDGEVKVVLIERILSNVFDVGVEDLVLEHLTEFSVLNLHGEWVVGAVVDDPSLFLGVFTKMLLFCNMHI